MKPQTAKEILDEAQLGAELYHAYPVALEMIQKAQRQAVQYALQVAAEEADYTYSKHLPSGDLTPKVDKQSILSLEQQILTDLGHK